MTQLQRTTLRHQMLAAVRDNQVWFDADGGMTCLRWHSTLSQMVRAYNWLGNAFLVVPRAREEGGHRPVLTIDGRAVLAAWDKRFGGAA